MSKTDKQHNTSDTSSEATTNPSRSVYLRLAATGVAATMIVALGWLAYAYMDLAGKHSGLQEEITNLSSRQKREAPSGPSQPSTTQQGTEQSPVIKPAPPKPDEYFRPSDSFIENTTAVFNTMNTQPLEGHMAPEVTLYYNSPKPATKLAPRPATLALDYFSDAKGPWNFRLPAADIAKYKATAGYDALFGNGCLTGRSATGQHIVSLCFTKEGKIHDIFMTREAPKLFR
ncbi:MAG: hypothetical protein Q4B05_01545 [Candidatus Saccharibacteria bacterium]|nr:hypothetical protein [Candidatus Saccharibacteria bacterium]